MSDDNNTSQRKYSARVFTRAPMICPHCRANLKAPVESCPQCKFNFAFCEKAFPFAAPPLSLVIDPTNLLPPGVEKDLKKAYQKVRKRAPQVDISFCFVRLQDGVAIEEFGFWLHNSAPAADETRAWQLLVVGDLTSGRLTLTTGYALEPFIKTELWEAALQELAACIADDQWKEGLNGFLIDARVLLTAAWQVAERRRLKNLERRRSAPPSDPEEAEQTEARVEEPPPPSSSSSPTPVKEEKSRANLPRRKSGREIGRRERSRRSNSEQPAKS